MNREELFAALGVGIVFFALFMWRSRTTDRPLFDPGSVPIAVSLAGDAAFPGTYLLSGPSATVATLLRAGGGAAKTGRGTMPVETTLQQELASGTVVRIERNNEGPTAIRIEHMGGAEALTLGFKLDLNTAGEGELCFVPLMRPAMVAEIVRRRRSHPWKSLDELQEISGIGPKTVEKWRNYLEISP